MEAEYRITALNFRFVDETNAKCTSQRQKELERAAQRAHAARISHRSRKEKAKEKEKARSSQSSISVNQKFTGGSLILRSSPQARSSLDPFDSLGLEITPEVHRIVIFVAEVYTPSIYIPNFFRPNWIHNFPAQDLIQGKAIPGSISVQRAIENVFNYPEALPAWIYGSCFRLAEFYAPKDHARLSRILLQYRAKSLRTLQEAIIQINDKKAAPTVTLVMQALHLLIAELLYGEKANAQAHMIILSWIEQLDIDLETRVHLMLNLVYSDTEMACKTMKKTVLDLDVWLPSKLGMFWAHSETFLPPTPSDAGNMHPSLNKDEMIHDTTLRLRRFLAIRGSISPMDMHMPSDTEAGHLRFTHMATISCWDIGRLLNRVVEIETNYQDDWRDAFDMSMALTILFSLRKYLHTAEYDGMDFREAPLLIPKLEWAIQELMALSTVEERFEIREELFWIFFTCAWHGEKGKQRRGPSYRLDMRNFNVRLALQAYGMGLTKWTDAQEVLTRFVFSDMMLPHPSDWYEKLIRKVPEERKMIASEEHRSVMIEGQDTVFLVPLIQTAVSVR